MANLQDRADAVRKKVKVLNGDNAISLQEFLLLKIGYDKNFIEACEAWIKAREI